MPYLSEFSFFFLCFFSLTPNFPCWFLYERFLTNLSRGSISIRLVRSGTQSDRLVSVAPHHRPTLTGRC